MELKDKLGDIVVVRASKGRAEARWRPVKGREAFLCAIDLSVYNKHAHIRSLFVELATEVQMNRECATGDGWCLRVREPLPASFRYSQFS
jgi:hypothetical protein